MEGALEGISWLSQVAEQEVVLPPSAEMVKSREPVGGALSGFVAEEVGRVEG